MKANS